jgi:hypothetical protein
MKEKDYSPKSSLPRLQKGDLVKVNINSYIVQSFVDRVNGTIGICLGPCVDSKTVNDSGGLLRNHVRVFLPQIKDPYMLSCFSEPHIAYLHVHHLEKVE